MLAICVEASHERGMGHLFRALNLISYLEEQGENYLLLINDDKASRQILDDRKIFYEVINFSDKISNWEAEIIEKHKITVWLNDKFESSYEMCRHIKEKKILLAAIDDRGPGAAVTDIHFVGMMFDKADTEIKGKRIYRGLSYNILNPEIEMYRRKRTRLSRIVVTLGGSDTYGVTILAVQMLKKYGYGADIILGNNFRHEEELRKIIVKSDRVYHAVPSLMQVFAKYDLAITGGGVTCLEANAGGLPCIIIANELHEIATGKFLEAQGGAVFAGYYQSINTESFDLCKINVENMSECALKGSTLDGRKNIYKVLKIEEKKYYGGK